MIHHSITGLENEDMENTTGAGTATLPKTKILRIAALIVFTFVICRGPLMEGYFPAAIAFITYTVSRNAMNIYLIIPAAVGIIPYITKGYDPWGDIAAMCVCGLLLVAARRIRMTMWQRAVIAASISIVCMSIYRLATGTVYKTSVEMLLLESLAIFSLVFVFAAFFYALEKGGGASENGAVSGNKGAALPFSPETLSKTLQPELLPVSFLIICLMALNGMMLSFLIWPAILFVALWFLTCADAGTALLAATAGGVTAALMDQAQWGVMATVTIGLAAAALFRRYGKLPVVAVFAAVCFALGSVESGVVLGADPYCLFIASAAFLALQWKFGARMGELISIFTGKEALHGGYSEREAENALREKIAEMESLTELYATYLDSRSMLANQFGITGQILEGVRWQLGKQGRKAVRYTREKFHVNIAIAQCAATGSINGDCCGWQEIGDGKTVMVVSDGMGKGKKAAAESLMVTRTIMSLLKSGATVDLTLKMINTIMLMKDDEDSYATVDLVMIDKKTGKAKFYKIGAAPTLIRRKSNVEEVKLSAVPLGIVNGLKVRYVETTLKKDDWIIMMSDGVSDGGSVGAAGSREFLYHIKETAADVRSADPQTMSDLLLNCAADSYIGRERDDMTVMVAKVV